MQDNPPTAISGEGHPPFEEDFREIGEILERDAEQIMARWYERASEEQVHADPNRREEAMNDLLEMLRSLSSRLKQQTTDALRQASELAQAHGRQRSAIGWDIVSLVRDYEILHGVALEHLGQVLGERLTYRQASVLVTVVDRATGSAVEAFSEMAQQRLAEQVQQQKAALRQLTLDLTDAEHHERQRIAQQLHDDLQQLLVAAQMRLEAALKSPSPDRSAVEQAFRLTHETISVTRNLTTELYPQTLENEGLATAIRRLADLFQQRYELTVTLDLHISEESNLGPLPLRRLVYDAIRELLFNVVKHAQTDQAWVKIGFEGRSSWQVEVEDRGVGMPDKGAERSSFGLQSVRQRMEQIGGAMETHSAADEGTRVVLTVPVEPTQ